MPPSMLATFVYPISLRLLAGQGLPAAEGAMDHDTGVLVGQLLGRPVLQEPARQGLRARDVSGLPLVGLANVDHRDALARA